MQGPRTGVSEPRSWSYGKKRWQRGKLQAAAAERVSAARQQAAVHPHTPIRPFWNQLVLIFNRFFKFQEQIFVIFPLQPGLSLVMA